MKKILSLTFFSFFLFSSVALADGGMNIYATYPNTQIPNSLVFELKPGAKAEDYFTVRNNDNETETFSIYAADNTLTNTFAQAYKIKNEPKLFAAKWIQIEKNTVTLNPNEQENIALTVNVPSDQPLHDYFAGIAMEKTSMDAQNPTLKIAFRQILPIQIIVTQNPQPILKIHPNDGGLTNVLNKTPGPYLWISIVIFILSISYYLVERKKEKNLQKRTKD